MPFITKQIDELLKRMADSIPMFPEVDEIGKPLSLPDKILGKEIKMAIKVKPSLIKDFGEGFKIEFIKDNKVYIINNWKNINPLPELRKAFRKGGNPAVEQVHRDYLHKYELFQKYATNNPIKPEAEQPSI